MSDEDTKHEGALSEVAAKILMKALWLGRLADTLGGQAAAQDDFLLAWVVRHMSCSNRLSS